jgi:uncharacterized membrane protein YhaH (DUF805 family)
MSQYRCLGCGASQAITLTTRACEYCARPIVIPSTDSDSIQSVSSINLDYSQNTEETKAVALDAKQAGFAEQLLFYFQKALLATFDFSSRASKAEYWFFVLAIFCVFLASSIFEAVLIDSFIGDLFGIVQVLFFILVIVTSTSLGVRRLHDIDRSGFWYLLCLIPLVGTLILLWWSIQSGTTGSNTYGEQPVDL